MNKVRNSRLTAVITIFLVATGMLAIYGAAPVLGANWTIVTADEPGQVGTSTSLALDSNDNPRISYYDYSKGNLKYAWSNDGGATWESTIVESTGCLGGTTSLKLDSNDNPRISYYDFNPRGGGLLSDLKFAWSDDGGATWELRVIDLMGDVGQYASLALDANDNPRVSYYDNTLEDLKFAWSDDGGDTWPCSQKRVVDYVGKVGEHTSLALDANGNPRISYADYDSGCRGPNCNLNFAWSNDGGDTWPASQVVTADGNGDVGTFTSLALDAAGNPAISYHDNGKSALKYAFSPDGGVSWNTITVDSGCLGWHTSLALNSAGNPHVSYYDRKNGDLKYATSPDGGANWATETVDSGGDVGKFTSIALTSADNPCISYHDFSNADLKYAYIEEESFGEPTLLSSRWFLAEGSTEWGFSTYLTIANPSGEALTAEITYFDPNPSGPLSGSGVLAPPQTVPLAPLSQTTVDVKAHLGSKDFSSKVECLEDMPIAVDRTMYWTQQGGTEEEAHNSCGVSAPDSTWYLPEGSSNHGFETFTLVLNPNSTPANIELSYMTEGAGEIVKNETVPANSRATYLMSDDIGAQDSSVKVSSDQPIVAEHAVYRNNRRGGSSSLGATEATPDSYLAEGCTAYGFTTYVLVQNPNDDPADITVSYMTATDGLKTQPVFTMPANSRKTICVNDVPGMENMDFSTHVAGTQPIITERAMYWNNGTGEAFHDSIAMDAPHPIFCFPDGETSNGRETYTLIQNPNTVPVEVMVTYLKQGGGTPFTTTETIPASSRVSFNMRDHSGIDGRAAIYVECITSNMEVMAERSMYWNNRGVGTGTIGAYSQGGQPQPY